MGFLNRALVTALPLVPKFIVGKVAARYVAGETLDDAIETIRQLNREGALATLDVLGEEVHRSKEADQAVEEYLQALDRIQQERLDANISVKPTQLGLKIDEAVCRDNIERLVEAARHTDNFVRLDMEDRTTTDATLRMYHHLHRRFVGQPDDRGYSAALYHHVGVVLQAYMRRTLHDISELPERGPNIRLCKGIYIEPRAVAWKGYETVRANFVSALEKAFERGVYVGIATHDEYLVCAAVALIDRLGLGRDQYEFQMLLGVDDELRRILIAEGHRLRIYVPYGPDWYLYSMRRLRENPEVAGHVMRAFLRGH